MIIQKFGGIAMKDQQMRKYCIDHIKAAIQQYQKVVVVVSAIGRLGDPYSTDSLLKITETFESDKEASDLAASCGELIAAAVLSAELHASGIRNKILHGANAGIETTGEFGDAIISKMNPSSIIKNLERVDCVIIPGFQGMNKDGSVMTLGRGGSDLTAIALSATLNASHTEFFKDVPGVMSHDPHLQSNPEKIDSMKIEQFIGLLDCERPIIQKRAAVYAKKTAMPLYIRGITGTETGTWILP